MSTFANSPPADMLRSLVGRFEPFDALAAVCINLYSCEDQLRAAGLDSTLDLDELPLSRQLAEAVFEFGRDLAAASRAMDARHQLESCPVPDRAREGGSHG